jgi:hypothetical protein
MIILCILRRIDFMQVRELYHGTNGDNILEIVRQGVLRPNQDGKIYFSERRFDSVLMHGADAKRRATFAVKVRVTIPPTAGLTRSPTAGVADTLVVATSVPLPAEVLELYVREPRARTAKTVKGRTEIAKYLSA